MELLSHHIDDEQQVRTSIETFLAPGLEVSGLTQIIFKWKIIMTYCICFQLLGIIANSYVLFQSIIYVFRTVQNNSNPI